MLVIPLVLIQIFSKRMLVDWPKCGSDPRDEGHLACLHSTQNSWYRIESTVRGHHVYKASRSPYTGEELPVQREVNNIHDDFAVLKNSNTVGHVVTTGNFQSLLVLPA